MRMGALTPAKTGLILVALVALGVMVVTWDMGVADLRGSLE